MPDSTSGRLRFDFSFSRPQADEPAGDDPILRIAVIGDFSGDAPAARTGTVRRVDIDNLDTAFAAWNATLSLPGGRAGEAPVQLAFRTLEDFHPDALLARHPRLAELKQIHSQLQSPATAAAATARWRERAAQAAAATAAPPPGPAPGASAPAKPAAESPQDTLSRLLGGGFTPAPTPTPTASTGTAALVDRLMREATGTSATPSPSPEQTDALAQVESELGNGLRAILHAPPFQALESAWRTLDRLVREAGETIHLHVINAPPLALADALQEAVSPLAAPVGRYLEPLAPALIVVLQAFDFDTLPALQRYAQLAASLRTALVADAASALAGCASFVRTPHSWDWTVPSGPQEEAFQAFRRTSEAAHVGLALPRFLLRQPYGTGSDPLSTLPFEEIAGPGDAATFLWGPSAALCAHVLANAFVREEDLSELSAGEVEGLPVHSARVNGEVQVTPTAEAWLSERDAQALHARGLMPVLSVRGRDAVLLPALRSLAVTATALPYRLN